MMKRLLLAAALLAAAFLIFAYAPLLRHSPPKHNTPTDETLMPPTDYDARWKEVSELESKGLTQDALKVVDEIAAAADSEKNDPQWIKAMLFRLKYNQQFQEKSDSLSVDALTQAIAKANAPRRNILQVLLADAYWSYYNNNQWQIMQRGAAPDDASKDFQTWDAQRFVREIHALYQAGLAPAATLQQIPVRSYAALLTLENNSEKYRPTLYDLLAFRAIEFFNNTHSGIAEPQEKFTLWAKDALVDAKTFTVKPFATPDTAAHSWHVVRLYQSLLRFHANDTDKTAFLDADLKRLSYLYNAAIGDQTEKDSAYVRELRTLASTHKAHPLAGEAGYLEAVYFYGKKNYVTAHRQCKAVIAAYPNTSGAINAFALQEQIEQKELYLTTEEVSVAQKPFRLLAQWRNMGNLHFRAIRLTDALRKDLESRDIVYNQEKRVERMLREKPLLTWSVALTPESDFQQHSAEVKVPALALGEYFIIASDVATFDAATGGIACVRTRISNLALSQQQITGAGENYGALYRLTDRATGKPLAGVAATEFERKSGQNEFHKTGKKYTTDANGVVEITRPRTYDSYYLTFERDGDAATSDSYYSYFQQEPQAARRVVFFLDRKIYRPGQTVFFKGIVYEAGNKKAAVVPSATIRVNFKDANWQDIEGKDFTSNTYGSFSGSFVAPKAGLTGQMQLSTDYGNIFFNVEEYKRPKFEVNFEPVKQAFRLNEMAKVEGVAAAFAGNKVDGAKVRWRVVREARYPYFSWWWKPAPSTPAREIANGEAQTNAEGKFTVNFSLTPDEAANPKDKPIFSYRVYADVIDITGETHSAETNVQAGFVALDISVEMPDEQDKNDAATAVIRSKNLNGEFERAKGSLKIYRLENPQSTALRTRRWEAPDRFILPETDFRREFPHDVYRQENSSRTWKRGALLAEKAFDTDSAVKNSSEIGIAELRTATPGCYVIELTTADRYGTEIKQESFFILKDRTSSRSALPMALETSFNKKDNIGVGETLTMTLKTSEAEVWVLAQIWQDGRELKRAFLRVANSAAQTMEFPIGEQQRGGISVTLAYVYHNEHFAPQFTFNVPYSNKELSLKWTTFRNKLDPGAKEQWKLHISGEKSEKVAAEMVAALYDASLDEFASNEFSFNPWAEANGAYYGIPSWSTRDFGANSAEVWNNAWQRTRPYATPQQYDYLQNWGFTLGWVQRTYSDLMEDDASMTMRVAGEGVQDKSERPMRERKNKALFSPALRTLSAAIPPPLPEMRVMEAGELKLDIELPSPAGGKNAESGKQNPPKMRTNLNETAFFMPALETDAEGNITLSFTMPEALTRWKFLGLAHTPDLKVGTIGGTTVTQKTLMVQPALPRFLRESDTVYLSAKIANLSDAAMTGSAKLQLEDMVSGTDITAKFQTAAEMPFTAAQGQSAVVRWKIVVPKGEVSALAVRISAASGDFSDGEENMLPVLSNRMLVTESLPISIKANQQKDFTFKKLAESGASATLTHQQVRLEFTSNPAWYAVQALPYLMEYPYDCTEQIFSRFYANTLASHIANSTPKIQEVFKQWKDTPNSTALLSNLEKNQDLKSAILTETPWVMQAQNETARKQHVGLLFDLSRMADEQSAALDKIADRQMDNGAFQWFPGMPADRYVTTLIVSGIGHLKTLKAGDLAEKRVRKLISRALPYLDREIEREYDYLRNIKGIKLEENHLSYSAIQYLYARSFFLNEEIDGSAKPAVAYYTEQCRKYWLSQSRYMQGMIALALHRGGDKATPQGIVKAMKQNAAHNEELGMYWKDMSSGYWWYEAPIETQALLIETFTEIDTEGTDAEEMKLWLLKNKQTNDWKTTRATADACYALLLGGDSNWLSENKLAEITMGEKRIEPKSVEAGTGYFTETWQRDQITPALGNISVKNPNKKGVAWGAVYWQYFEQLDKITYAATPLAIEKQLFREINTPTGPKLENITPASPLAQGDKVVVRVVIRCDRDMEYVHLKDMRAAGFEPVDVLSGYEYKNGLGYYRSTKDVASHFFMGYLPKGTHVFEYVLRATHSGKFSNGITTMQCMYAPEFTTHSAGIRVEIK